MDRVSKIAVGVVGTICVFGLIGAISPKTEHPPQAPSTATIEGPAAVPTPDKAWAAFVDYAPKLADLLKRSDAIDKDVAASAGNVTAANLARFYTIAGQASTANSNLRRSAQAMRVPSEATAFRDSVAGLLFAREDAYDRLKDALDKPGVRATAEYQQAKALLDPTSTVLKLFALCEKLHATPDECTEAVGWNG